MKTIPFILLLIVVTVGCDSNAPVTNSYENTVTHRQKIVEFMGTTEVFQLPYTADEYIVRATNGAIWYICANKTSNSGRTMIFNRQLAVQDTIPLFGASTNLLIEDPLQ